MKRRPRWAVALALAAASAASGCLLGPDYARPPVEVPASYGEAQAASAAQARSTPNGGSCSAIPR